MVFRMSYMLKRRSLCTLVTRPDIVGHQCAQSPLSTRLTARPIWDKIKNKDFMKTAGFNERPPVRKVTPMFVNMLRIKISHSLHCSQWYGLTSSRLITEVKQP